MSHQNKNFLSISKQTYPQLFRAVQLAPEPLRVGPIQNWLKNTLLPDKPWHWCISCRAVTITEKYSNFRTGQFSADKFEPHLQAMSTLGYLSLFTAEKKARELSCTWNRCCKDPLQRHALLCSPSPATSHAGNCRGGDKTKLYSHASMQYLSFNLTECLLKLGLGEICLVSSWRLPLKRPQNFSHVGFSHSHKHSTEFQKLIL